MAQRPQVHTALAENLSLVPAPKLGVSQLPVSPTPKSYDASACTHMPLTHK